MFNAFEELFSPGRKHTRDEQNRLELTREDVGDADPGRGPIDLASGKVVVRRPKAEDAEDAEDDEEPGESGASEQGGGPSEPEPEPEPEPGQA
ncbi:DUF6191 domain-containing protein [Streptomyces sp. NPDC101225]|uniref:DUF6191 domain-containing protein n=1 Tax=Streptomyces sp. NPDC101225 TaxID=3366135 RepID=UPI003806579E